MVILKSIISALSTFSKIPMPNISYKENEGRYTLIFFPLVGLIIGFFIYAWYLICWYLETADYIFSIGAMLIPLFVTGGIHLDGYMDSMDAINSYGSQEKRLLILKDPHIGAFSVIKLLELTGVWFIAITLSADYWILLICLGFVASRIFSALAIIAMDTAKEDGMVHYTKTHGSAACKYVLLAFLCLLIGVSIFYFEKAAILPWILSIFCYLYYNYRVKKDFGGITGDTAGCYLVMTETAWILAIMIYSVWSAI